ncbi:MauE/DoxX family redox-associated membrane protein [Sphingobacterium sp. UDSM-2020]|uniref:MauE/DoxX family redox-associated membrane protein n=1 Tax=Sphingobacterium sp. UDSM-2020 TaxID=2795738 RepID=UPI001E54ACEC|nr:MauE/DoxX family redox-associated membrane protein [Sphingobacterium sp. UDSM-2020]
METIITYQDQRKRKQIAFNIVIALLLLLWVPVSIDKLIDFAAFKDGILNQPFSDSLGYVLIYTLPAFELLIVFALVSEKFRRIGLILSILLMAVFTGYVAVALLGAWEKLPCGCGSVIRGMTWTQHFFFNLFFLVLSVLGLYLWYKLRGSDVGNGTTEGGSAKRQL